MPQTLIIPYLIPSLYLIFPDYLKKFLYIDDLFDLSLRTDLVDRSLCCSGSQSCLDYFWPHGLQHTRLPCPSPSPRACSNSCPLNQWCNPTISSSVIPFSSCLQHQWKWNWKSLSHVRLLATPWTIQPMEFSRSEYWSGLLSPTPGDFLNSGIEPLSFASPLLAGGFFTTVPPGELQKVSMEECWQFFLCSQHFPCHLSCLQNIYFFTKNRHDIKNIW